MKAFHVPSAVVINPCFLQKGVPSLGAFQCNFLFFFFGWHLFLLPSCHHFLLPLPLPSMPLPLQSLPFPLQSACIPLPYPLLPLPLPSLPMPEAAEGRKQEQIRGVSPPFPLQTLTPFACPWGYDCWGRSSCSLKKWRFLYINSGKVSLFTFPFCLSSHPLTLK